MERFGNVPSVCQSSNAYRREILARFMPIDVGIWIRSIDTFLNGLALAHGPTVQLTDVLAGYRIHERSLSQENTREIALQKGAIRTHCDLELSLREVLGPEQGDFVFNLPRYHWYHRLAALRLAPENHPFPEDTHASLVRSIRAAPVGPFRGYFGFRAIVWLVILLLAHLPRPVLRATFPFLVRNARWLSLIRGDRGGLREMAPDLRVGTHWRAAFWEISGQIANKGLPGDGFGSGMSNNDSNVGAIGPRRQKPPCLHDRVDTMILCAPGETDEWNHHRQSLGVSLASGNVPLAHLDSAGHSMSR